MPNPSSRPQWLTNILESEHVFKGIAFVYFFLLMGATFGVFKLLTDDPQHFKDFGVFIAIVSIAVACALTQLTLKQIGVDASATGGDTRLKIYLYGGFGAAILLALLLSIYNHTGTMRALENEETSRAAREAAGRSERDPGIQRAAELMNQRREKAATQGVPK